MHTILKNFDWNKFRNIIDEPKSQSVIVIVIITSKKICNLIITFAVKWK